MFLVIAVNIVQILPAIKEQINSRIFENKKIEHTSIISK